MVCCMMTSNFQLYSKVRFYVRKIVYKDYIGKILAEDEYDTHLFWVHVSWNVQLYPLKHTGNWNQQRLIFQYVPVFLNSLVHFSAFCRAFWHALTCTVIILILQRKITFEKGWCYTQDRPAPVNTVWLNTATIILGIDRRSSRFSAEITRDRSA